MSDKTVRESTGNSSHIKENSLVTREEAVSLARDVLNNTRHCLVGTNGEDGYPNIKTMSNRRHEGIKTIWFATDTSSMRVQQLKKDNRACVYCLDAEHSRALMLVGDMEILKDIESKKMLWRKGEGKYRPLGVEDPDYSVLRFTAKWANFVDLMENKGLTFEIE
jgi:general stress protein 26